MNELTICTQICDVFEWLKIDVRETKRKSVRKHGAISHRLCYRSLPIDFTVSYFYTVSASAYRCWSLQERFWRTCWLIKKDSGQLGNEVWAPNPVLGTFPGYLPPTISRDLYFAVAVTPMTRILQNSKRAAIILTINERPHLYVCNAPRHKPAQKGLLFGHVAWKEQNIYLIVTPATVALIVTLVLPLSRLSSLDIPQPNHLDFTTVFWNERSSQV